MYESKDKMVSHPSHYEIMPGVEVIDIIEAVTADMKGVEATDTANIIKYACRWKKKNGIQDLEKLIWYATHLVEHLKKEKDGLSIVNDDSGPSIIPPIRFVSKTDAVDTVKQLEELISRYGFATVGDLYELINWPIPEDEFDYGWTDMDSADIETVGDEYLLFLPGAKKQFNFKGDK